MWGDRHVQVVGGREGEEELDDVRGVGVREDVLLEVHCAVHHPHRGLLARENLDRHKSLNQY